MEALDALRARIPDAARDIRLNLSSVMKGGALSEPQRWGVAVASAIATRSAALREAVLGDAARATTPEVIEDARAAAAVMAMNNVYYRFRHMADNPVYGQKPAGLRMNRLAQPATNRADFELFALAVSAINGCEACIRAHDKAVLQGGLTPDHVNDAVRIAATMQGVAVALEMGVLEPAAP